MSGEYYGREENTGKLYSSGSDVVSSGHKANMKKEEISDHVTRIHAFGNVDKGKLKTQTSKAITTDNPRAAIRTISNILNGLSNSINKISVLQKSPRFKPSPIGISVIKSSSSEKKLDSSDSDQNVENETKNSLLVDAKPKIKKRSSTATSRKKFVGRISTKPSTNTVLTENPSSSLNNKKLVLKRLKPTARSLAGSRRSTMFPRCKTAQSAQISCEKLVEIYHNAALEGSDSDDGNGGSKAKKTRDANRRDEIEIPPLNIPGKNTFSQQRAQSEFQMNQNGFHYEEPQAPRTEISSYARRYELPTIASRMKKVTKSYFNSFNFKAIPFCASTSITPSHNIGINIQQFMNIMKTKQPLNGISPTLAHNIGLAAERLNGKPLSSLVTTMASKIYSRCPLVKSSINYQHLQEMARSVPEDTIVEADEDDTEETPTLRTVVITGPSGDTEVKNRKVTVWSTNPSCNNVCTCAPKSGVEIDQITNKHLRGSTVAVKQQSVVPVNRRSQRMLKKKTPSKVDIQSASSNDKYSLDKPFSKSSDLLGKEKNLKDVLGNLHNEFDSMNKRYEELSKKIGTAEETREITDELEKIEKDLNNKEEEITIVMALYKEVLALKQQVKALKMRASQHTMMAKESSKFGEYNNPQAAFHLTKLLRQIQHYQTHYKRDVCPIAF